MHYIYCPECGEKLVDKPAGDEGLVPFCEKCGKFRFDMFDSCVIILVANEFDEPVLNYFIAGEKEFVKLESGLYQL